MYLSINYLCVTGQKHYIKILFWYSLAGFNCLPFWLTKSISDKFVASSTSMLNISSISCSVKAENI